MVTGVVRALRATGGRAAPAAAALALTALLLLLLAPRAPLPRPAPASPARPDPRPFTSPAPAPESRSPPPPVEPTKPDAAGGAGAGAELVRARYVAGFRRAHPELCAARGRGLRLLVLVTSAPAHSAARAAVRHTWGHAALRADVALGFVLGAAPPALRAALDAEDAVYGDLIEARFVDDYLNLTLKTLAMLEWAETRCPLAPRLLKADDDVFVNVEALLRFAEEPVRRDAADAVWGRVWRGGRPVRDRRSKFFVPRSEFAGARYPAYLGGPAYLVGRAAARRLRAAAAAARWLRMEDALVTGVAADAARVRRVDEPRFLKRPARVARACALRRAFAVHPVAHHEQFDLWRKLHDGTECPT